MPADITTDIKTEAPMLEIKTALRKWGADTASYLNTTITATVAEVKSVLAISDLAEATVAFLQTKGFNLKQATYLARYIATLAQYQTKLANDIAMDKVTPNEA